MSEMDVARAVMATEFQNRPPMPLQSRPMQAEDQAVAKASKSGLWGRRKIDAPPPRHCP